MKTTSPKKRQTSNSGKRKKVTAPVSLSVRLDWNEKQVQNLKNIINTDDLTRYLELYLRNAIVWSAVGTAISLIEVTANEEE